MALDVIDSAWQYLREDVARAKSGDAEAARRVEDGLTSMVSKMTTWQWVIHGDTRAYRLGAVKHLLATGEMDRALRFALCGRGDVLLSEIATDKVRVRPRGCGCRFCPRCSRRSGQRFLKRIGGHLEAHAHGEITHFVLTQPVRPEESVQESRDRFSKTWVTWYRCLRRVGMESALLTQHVKPRETRGWHYHGHCIVEWQAGADVVGGTERLEACWQKAAKEESGREKGLFSRKVCDAGDAFGPGGFGRQGDFWAEPEGAVQRVLQYAVRDIVQGCESWVGGLRGESEIAAFASVIDGAKLHRLFGLWRKKVVPAQVVAEVSERDTPSVDGAGRKVKAVMGWREEMRVEEAVERSRNHESAAISLLQRLSEGVRNRGKVAERLNRMVRSVSVLRRAG